MFNLQTLNELNLSSLSPEIYSFIVRFIFIVIMVGIVIWIYQGLAYMKIAEKTNTENGWLAFIPIANFYLMSKIAKMHWWPILLIIGFFIPILNIVSIILFMIFVLMWEWKIFEAVQRSGWWVLFQIIPYLGFLIYLILLGIAAWSKPKIQSH